jgi:hypothetical protein
LQIERITHPLFDDQSSCPATLLRFCTARQLPIQGEFQLETCPRRLSIRTEQSRPSSPSWDSWLPLQAEAEEETWQLSKASPTSERRQRATRRGNLAAQQGQSDLRAETTRDKKRKPGSSARPVRPPSGDNARQQRRLLPKTIKAEQQPAAAHCYTRIFHRFSPQIQADSVDLRLGFPIRLPWLRRTPSAGGSASSWRSRPSTPPSSPPTRAGSRTPRPPPLQGGGRRVPLRRP